MTVEGGWRIVFEVLAKRKHSPPMLSGVHTILNILHHVVLYKPSKPKQADISHSHWQISGLIRYQIASPTFLRAGEICGY